MEAQAVSPEKFTPPPVRPLSGPKGLPLLGNVLSFARDQLGFLTDCARTHGDIVKLNLAGWPAVLVSDMAAIEKILVKDHRNFVKNELVWRHARAVFGNGLLTSEGDFWLRQRRLAAPSFAGQQLLGYGPDMVTLAQAAIRDWKDGDILDVHPEMMNLALRVAAKTLFSSEVEEDIAAVDHALDDMLREFQARLRRPVYIPDNWPLPGHLRYRRGIQTVERVVHRMIAERRRDGIETKSDFLSRLMAARDENGQPMSDTQLRDEVITLLLAGHETTALTLSWTLHLLGSHPEIQQKMGAELDQVLGGRPVTVDDLSALKYTDAVLTEAMRVYPPAWLIGRSSVGEFEIGGHRFTPKTTVFISQWVLHRDPRYFPDPLTFRPERWLDRDFVKGLPRYAYMPFGGGPRICIGQRFTMIEATLMLATIAQAFSVEWQKDRKIKMEPTITLRPGGGVWVKLTDRRLAGRPS